MSMKRKKLSFEERLRVIRWNRLGHSASWISKSLGRHRSTVYHLLERMKELKARDSSLQHEESFVISRRLHEEARKRHSEASSRRMRLKSQEIRVYVEWGLKRYWSVQAIAGRLRIDIPGAKISYEAIYQWINTERPDLKGYLPVAGKSRRRRRAGRTHRKLIRPQAPKKSIEIRPEIATSRKRIGDYELDAILSCRGSKSALQVLVDRRTRKVFLGKVSSLEAFGYAKTLCCRIHRDALVVHSITSDNGSEHADFSQIESCLNIEWFFSHPYCASERGTVENRNRAIRKFFPKGTSFDDIPDEYIQWVEDYINDYPLEVLNFLTPNERIRKSINPQGRIRKSINPQGLFRKEGINRG